MGVDDLSSDLTQKDLQALNLLQDSCALRRTAVPLPAGQEVKPRNRTRSRIPAEVSKPVLHVRDAPQVGDLCLQDLDVSECLSLDLILSLQAEVGLTRIHRVQPGELSLQLGSGLFAALKEGLKIRRAQQLAALLVLQMLDLIPPTDHIPQGVRPTSGLYRSVLLRSFHLTRVGPYLLEILLCLALISLSLLCRLLTRSSAIRMTSPRRPRPLASSVRKFWKISAHG